MEVLLLLIGLLHKNLFKPSFPKDNMALTREQIEELKSQLRQQIQHLPKDKRAEALQQIESLSPQSLEMMLKQQSSSQKAIFRMIVNKEVESVIVKENPVAVAVLDINPISKGHILIIPKAPAYSLDKIPESAIKLAEELAKDIMSNLKAKKVKIEKEVKFNEAIIDLIPVYDSPVDINSPRKKADVKSLLDVKRELEAIKLEKKVEKIKINKKELPQSQLQKLKRRIP